MSCESNELRELRQRLEKIKFELERVKAVEECQNLMGRYIFWHISNMHEEKKSLFANEECEDFRVEVFESYQGKEGFDRYVRGHSSMGKEFDKGTIRMHALTTPVIEVAADGKTARGVWVCPGYETSKFPKFEGATDVDDMNFKCCWAWNKYGVDFILTDEGWKIRHLHVYGLFMTDFYRSWADQDADGVPGWGTNPPPPLPSDEEIAKMEPEMRAEIEKMKLCRANGPSTHPTWHYARDKAPENYPAPPEPYNTWDDVTETY